MVFRVSLVTLALVLFSCKKEIQVPVELPKTNQKIAGASMVASNDLVQDAHFDSLQRINAKWVALIPFALGYWDSTELIFDHPKMWKGETIEGMRHAIELANTKGLQIMLKPQIWFWDGHFTGHFNLQSEQEWTQFENQYGDYILRFAELAEQTQAPIFCLGTELGNFVAKRPQFWNSLIDSIRNNYSGKLVYAANWDNYKQIPFWTRLDYIGVDAYFPVSEEQTPSVRQCESSWASVKSELKKLSVQVNVPVLFTEYGYCSIDYTGKEPWNPPESGSVNMQAQVNTYQALYNSVWGEAWFAGGFLWKWFENDQAVGGINHKRFTPQNKPVEQVIRSVYID